MDMFEEIREVDEALVEHSAVRFKYGILNPINRDEEWEKFKQDNSYNPQLRYNSFDAQYHIDGLESLQIPTDHPLSDLLGTIRDDLLIEAKALRNIGTPEFDVSGIFPPLSRALLEAAKAILEKDVKEEPSAEKDFDDKEFAEALRQRLNHYGCRGWLIKYNTNAGSRISVSAGLKRITIREGERFSQDDIDKLIRHEIETHVLRAVNGDQQPLRSCTFGLPQYLAAEEGLAMYNEEQVSRSFDKKLRYMARHVIISYYASRLGFARTFDLVKQYYSDHHTCFKTICRAKRGLADTSQPGGYIKDHCYLQGYYQIKEFVEAGGDIRLLYAGKIGLEHVHLVEEGLLRPASVLPDFLME